MTKKVRQKLLEKLNWYIKQSADGKGMVGSLSQEPYRGDVFQLFAAAWGPEMALTGDALLDELERRWPLDRESREYQLRFTVCARWNEWRYAFDRCKEPHDDAVILRDKAIRLICWDTLDRTERLISCLWTTWREGRSRDLALTAEEQNMVSQAMSAVRALEKVVKRRCRRRPMSRHRAK